MAEEAHGYRPGKKGRVLEDHFTEGQVRHGFGKKLDAGQICRRDFFAGEGYFFGNIYDRLGDYD